MKSLTLIEIDVPEFSDTARQAGFDGSTYLTRGADLTGIADSKLMTFSAWVYIESGLGGRLIASATTLGGATARTRCVLSTTDNRFSMVGTNAAGTAIGDIQSSPLEAGRWHHVMGSLDLTDTAKRHIYVNDVADIAVVNAFTDDTIDFTLADWGVGALPSGANALNGAIGDLWFAPGVYIDLSVEANRRKFISASGRPVSLGSDGSTPTGSAPRVFLSGALASWHTNKGTGGGFTVTGSLTEVAAVDQTFRFAKDVSYLPREFDAIPSITNVSFSPITISLGSNLGQRASLTITFKDHPHIMNEEPFTSGTFWGKFRARYGLRLRGRPVRWYTGLEGQTLEQMEVRHFIIESTEGPKPDGSFSIIAKDVLKLADNDRAQAPVLSNGFLLSAIDDNDLSATLSPSGIGNSEYPASGYVAIGGEEICAFTRSGDVLTLTRGQLGTTATEHDEQDRVQLVLRYAAEDPADIIYDLLVNYGGVDASYINLTNWQNETGAYLQRVYTATIPEPTGVNKLVSELIEQAALAVWWDDVNETIRLQVLRPIPSTAAVYSEENTLQGSLSVKEQPNTRVSSIWTYFGMKNPLRPVDEPDNYRSTAITTDDAAELDYGGPAIKKIFSRWIPAFGRSVATKLNQLILGRFVDPPRRFTFDVWRYNEGDDYPILGTGYQLESWIIQDVTGAAAQTPIQITRLNPMEDKFQIEAEELLFDTSNQDVSDRVIIIDSNTNNFNLREVHDTLYPEVTGSESPAITVTCIVQEGVTVGSSSVNSPAFTVGDWPVGLSVSLEVIGRIQGRGGVGADGSEFGFFSAYIGGYGGPALYTDFPINLDCSAGEIWGGGGGGGGGKSAAGAGGAGKEVGQGGTFFPAEGDPVQAPSGTQTAGGAASGDAGDGGDPGEYGHPGAPSKTLGNAPVGGFAGAAIYGVDKITFQGSPEGSILGPRYDHIRSVAAVPGDGSSIAVQLPPGRETGDLLLIFVTAYRGDVEDESDDISLTTPSGWTQLYHTVGPSFLRRGACYYRVATGSEGSTVTVNASRSGSFGSVAYAIRDYTGTPEAATATGTSTTPDSPNLTPSWGNDEVLLFSTMHVVNTDLEESNEPPDAPTNYQGNIGTLYISSSHRRATITSENPGSWAQVNSVAWVASTVAVRTA